ncbi:MAG: T9SS type A sorting domain-containing protein [Ignavibacteriaceae bacterium]|nr:T9SS type A sorting domain-containing protein [Ignavibacteriaceae bacterium]
MSAKILLHTLLFWAALSLIALTATSCSESASSYPFNPQTSIRYTIMEQGEVTITLHDVIGREVGVLVNENKEPGSYVLLLDATGFSSGEYFYTMKINGKTFSKKSLVMK